METLSAPSERREYPHIPLSELSEYVHRLTHVRDRAMVAMQLKLGLRVSELCNLQLPDVRVADRPLNAHYGQLGRHPRLADHPNALYVAHDRPENKSRRPRVLPLDAGLRDVLTDWLSVRPDNGAPWVFLSMNNHAKLRRKDVNPVWKSVFHPAYDGSEEYAPVTSHSGRHRFTTYWRVDQDLPEELVKYMRGDTPGGTESVDQRAIGNYLHTFFEDIESVYRTRIFSL